jgi:4,5-dihydroxyphthalate decarboxylase
MKNQLDRRQAIQVVGAAALARTAGASAPARRSGDLAITVAGYEYDRVANLADGRVPIEGCEHRFEKSSIYELNAVAMGGDQRFEIQEIGLHPYMLAFANGDLRDYTLIPVFPLRTFRHKSLFIRTDRGIEKPADLRGKKVVTPGYSQSSLTWIRGMLQHEYGVAPGEMEWIITRKSSDAGQVSKNESQLPEGVPITMGPEGKDESELLVSGAADAALTAMELPAFVEGNPLVARLFSNYRATERAYFTKTGIFPIMHAVAIRNDVVKENPWLPKATFEAYSRAKELNYQAMNKLGWAMSSLPWFGAELEATRELMGDNFWPYGIAPNRKALEALFQYSHEQGLASQRLTIEELFHPSTLELVER